MNLIGTIKNAINYPREFIRRKNAAKQQKAQDWERIQCLLRKLDKAQKQLRMYKEFWNHSPDAFLLVGCPDGEILDANPAACSLYGYDHACVTDLNLADISAEHESTRAVYANRLEFIPVRLHKNHDGTKILVTATISYFFDQEKEIAACIIRPLMGNMVMREAKWNNEIQKRE